MEGPGIEVRPHFPVADTHLHLREAGFILVVEDLRAIGFG